MEDQDFKDHARHAIDWIARYLGELEHYPVRPAVEPGEISARLAAAAPEQGEPMDRILGDFRDIIVPGITHWQHPAFFGYFPANSSPPSVLADMLTSALGVIVINWEASPAATELEQRMMIWLRDAIGLPDGFTGVIQGSASEGTLCALLTARERALGFKANEQGLAGGPRLTSYCSEEAHSSVEKDVRIAGLGSANLRKIATDADFAMDVGALETAIKADIAAGARPVCVIATLGTTGVSGFDSLAEIGAVCRKHDIWLHVDAAWAGSALIIEEYRWMLDGIEYVDSFLFNPHKWLLTNFDCSAYFVRDVAALTGALGIAPEYLKSSTGHLTEYRDWTIPLGRRFRALKLWFVLRAYGLEGLRHHISRHIALAKDLAAKIDSEPDFELTVAPRLALFCFRYRPTGSHDDCHIDDINRQLVERIKASGKAYLTHTLARGRYVIRFSTGQLYTEQRHIDDAWDLIKKIAREMPVDG